MIDESTDAYSYWVLVGWFFFFFLEYIWVGLVGYLVNNYFDLKIWLGLVLFRTNVGLFFRACSVTIFFFFFLDFSSNLVWHKNFFEGVPNFF